jgi:hypothetical protein
MADDTPDLAAARHDGSLDAERLDRSLRAVESDERRRRLALLEDAAPPPAEVSALPRAATPAEVERLRREVEQLAAFRAAVLGSRAWRSIQALRRLVGRAW